MSIEWLFDRISDHTMKLWRYEVVGGFEPQRLRENVYLAPTLRREIKKKLLDGGVTALPKVLEAYIGEVVLSTDAMHLRQKGMASTGIGQVCLGLL